MSDQVQRLTAALADRYAIESELGAGGMATVYLADDLKHHRKVAVKVLRPELAAALGSERFLQEVRVTARLQHPNILTLIDSGDAEGFLYYVMPYVEGESLRARLQREKQLPLDDTLQITREVADGLDYAHSEGFVHRDIKPENVLLSRGHAVVADFGIALGVSAAGGERLTETGLSLGTPEYMSPEQATGERDLDGRSDTYSLGCVVYEMLVGEPPFTGTTAQAVMARHALDPVPSMRTVRGSIPEHIEQVVGRALEKIPADRFTTSGRLAAALAQPDLAVTRSDARKVQGTKRFGRLPQLSAAALVVALIAFSLQQLRQQGGGSPTPIHTQLTFTGDVWLTAISPDGQSIAYASFGPDPSREAPLMVQDVGGGQAVRVHTIDPPFALQWSPDGAELLFDTRAWGPGDTYVVPRLGGTVRRLITDWLPRWSPDGSQIASFPSNYFRRSSRPKQITLTDTQTGDTTSIPLEGPFDLVMAGDWSPSGQLIAIVTATAGQAGMALWTTTADGGPQQLVFQDSVWIVSPRWSPRGDAIYYVRASLGSLSGGTEELVKIPMSEATGTAQGPPETLLSGLQITQSEAQLSPISVSADGRRLVYSREAQHSNLWLATVGEAGAGVTPTQLTTGTALIENFAVSPDGETVVYPRLGATGSDLLKLSLDGGAPEQLTFSGSVLGGDPAWSPDGRQLAFNALDGQAGLRLWVMDAGGGSARQLGQQQGRIAAWAPLSRILFWPLGEPRLHLLDPASDQVRTVPSSDSVGGMYLPQYAPDGRHIAVAWRRPSDTGLWLLSSEDSSQRLLRSGDFYPIGWSADGEFVYAVEGYGPEVRAVPVNGGPDSLVATIPLEPMRCQAVPGSDGRKFVCIEWIAVSDVWMVENFDPEAGRTDGR